MAWAAIGRAALPYVSRAATTTFAVGRNYVAKNAIPAKEALRGTMRLGWEIHKDNIFQTGNNTVLGRHSAMVAPYLMERRYP